MKKSFWKVVTVMGVALAVIIANPSIALAETVTSIVMTYQDKVYTKQIYDPEVEQIKAGVETEGLRDVGALIDQLAFQTNGEVSVDKASVIAAVKSAIAAGSTGINIDLTKYEKGAMAAAAANTAAPAVPAASSSGSVSEAVANAAGIDTKLSEASTKFRANEDRAQNIRNAASKINGMIILPGQMFSADAAFGPRTEANGYGYGNIEWQDLSFISLK